jgi:hypothetical protein
MKAQIPFAPIKSWDDLKPPPPHKFRGAIQENSFLEGELSVKTVTVL